MPSYKESDWDKGYYWVATFDILGMRKALNFSSLDPSDLIPTLNTLSIPRNIVKIRIGWG